MSDKVSLQETAELVASYSILIDGARCTGCRRCEMACSIKRTGICGTSYSRVRLVQFQWEGDVISSPALCQNCIDPPCEKVCPTGATHRNAETGLMDVDDDLCIGCKGCVHSCPFGACFINPLSDRAFRCDQCGGDPVCVKACPEQVLLLVPNGEMNSVIKRRRRFLSPLGQRLAGTGAGSEDNIEKGLRAGL